MPNIIIRVDKIHDLILSCNKEKVYFLFHHGQIIDNSMDYDFLSDKFNQITKGESMQYPEFENAIEMITDNTCQLITDFAKSIKSENPYKCQYILEEVIKKLQERV